MFGKPKNSPSVNKEPYGLDIEPGSSPPVNMAEEIPKPAVADPKRDHLMSSVLSSQKPSVISEGFSVTGDIRSEGILHVEGKVAGTVVAHSINISFKGEVEGEIRCHSLNIKGTFQGVADCDELVVASSAQVSGKIFYRYITIGSGAMVRGELAVKDGR
jgi:cytoskeletal protein CcmA (bactofilin family)